MTVCFGDISADVREDRCSSSSARVGSDDGMVPREGRGVAVVEDVGVVTSLTGVGDLVGVGDAIGDGGGRIGWPRLA